jgi:hypothetical protein
MLRSLRVRLAASVGVVALALASPAMAYEPFVTDFPEGVAPVEPHEPFVTSFGTSSIGDQSPRVAPAADRSSATESEGAVDWRSLGVGIAAGLGLAVLIGGSAAAVRRHRQTALA